MQTSTAGAAIAVASFPHPMQRLSLTRSTASNKHWSEKAWERAAYEAAIAKQQLQDLTSLSCGMKLTMMLYSVLTMSDLIAMFLS